VEVKSMEATTPQRRLVLLGASNACNGLSVIVDTARRLYDQPLEVMTAIGHGRSYGRDEWVFFRGLPGILHSGLWPALDAAAHIPTAALVSDIGNDLLYDVLPEQIAEWVRDCLRQLKPRAERIVLTSLPVDNLGDLSDWWFLFMRTIQFPRCGLDRATVVARAHELNDRISELAREFDVSFVRLEPKWYGMDPVHFRFTNYSVAWRSILAPLLESDAPPHGGSWLEWLYCWGLWPKKWFLLRRDMSAKQPAGRLVDGTTIACY